MVRHTGLEPVTTRLKVVCSTIWANDAHFIKIIGVINGARTRDNEYHKLALYQLNYDHHMACLKRFELLTHALEGRCSIQLSYRHILKIFNWSGRRGSNSRHSAWKADALPTELLPHNIGRNSKIRTCGPLLPRQVRYLTALYSDVCSTIACYINIVP